MVLKKLATTIKSSQEYEHGWSRDEILKPDLLYHVSRNERNFWYSKLFKFSSSTPKSQGQNSTELGTKSLLWWRRSIFITPWPRDFAMGIKNEFMKIYWTYKKKSFFSFQTDNHRITEVFFLFFFFFFFCCFSRERCDPWSLCLFTGNLHMNTLFSVLVENI